MRTITEGLLGRQTATADANLGTARETILGAVCVVNRKIALNDNRTVIQNTNFRSSHGGEMVTQSGNGIASRKDMAAMCGNLFQYNKLAVHFTVLLLAVCNTFAQSGISQDVALAAVRKQLAQTTEAASRHACVLHIHRVQDKQSARQTMEEHATVEAIFANGKTLYSWPGESPLQSDDLRDLLVMGLSSSGSLLEQLRSIVNGGHARFGESVSATVEGAQVLQIPYDVPAANSGYIVNLDGKEAKAGIRGVIALRQPALTLSGFTLEATDLPPQFPATSVEEAAWFAQSGAGGSVGWPTKSTQKMVEGKADVYSNDVVFESCREFQGESSIRFDDSDKATSAPDAASNSVIPPGIAAELQLRQPLVYGKVRAGDRIEASLTKQIKWKGEVLAPEGARVLGRVVEFKQIQGAAPGYLIGLRFDVIEVKGKQTAAPMSLETLTDMPKGARRGIAAAVRGANAPYQQISRPKPDGSNYPASGFIRISTETGELPKGFAMRWVVDGSR